MKSKDLQELILLFNNLQTTKNKIRYQMDVLYNEINESDALLDRVEEILDRLIKEGP